ncbi:MAG: hypothetical protein AAGA66_14185 [Bacteroidota bacterium]
MAEAKQIFSLVFKEVDHNEPGYVTFQNLIREENLNDFFFESDPFLEYGFKFNFSLQDTDTNRLKIIQEHFTSVSENSLILLEYHDSYAFRGGMKSQKVFQECSHQLLKAFLKKSSMHPELYSYDFRYNLAHALISELLGEVSISDAFDADMYEAVHTNTGFFTRAGTESDIPHPELDHILEKTKDHYTQLRDDYRLFMPTNYKGSMDDFINYQMTSLIMDQLKIYDVAGRRSLFQKQR